MKPHRDDPAKRHFRFEELFVALALEKAFPEQSVRLHPAEAAVDLAPDIVMGSPSSPQIVVSVTRLSAQNAVQVKAWRDVYELLLYRRLHPSARVFRVLFGEPGAASWNRALEQVFDVHLFVRALPDGTACERLLHELTGRGRDLPAHAGRHDGDPAGRDFLIANLDGPSRACLNQLAERLAGRKDAPAFRGLLPGSTSLTEPFFPTALRRTIVLLGMFPELAATDARGRVTLAMAQEAWFRKAGIMASGGVLAQPWRGWVQSAHAAVGRRTLERLVAQAAGPSRRIRTRVLQVRRTLAHFGAWFEALAACDDPPRALAGSMAADTDTCAACGGHPVLLALRNLLKLDGGDAFGNARLLHQLGLGRDTSDLYRVSRWFSGEEPPDPDAPWQNLWPWFERAQAILGSTTDLETRVFAPLFFDEAMKNRQIEPLGQLVRELVGEAGTLQVRHPTFLDPTGAVGTVRCFRVRYTVIHWKTAHDGHRDKTKELAAKGVAMRLAAPRERFVLLTDGDFTERDLGALASSGGWDWVIPVSSWQKEGASVLRRL
ncbi:MAG: hypothetical protein CVU59_09060 [Deltaproteobacteria bacterium HGW-Deltaproteobacteria-17]|nr:MAG: hypothetical protein CVU59_09060 [Deltaproteobacteria bacterium HGW-Deltaproteobacteria-17]